MMTVPLGGKKAAGRVALIDDEDYELVSRHKWYTLAYETWIYACATSPGSGGSGKLRMHKLITGYPLTDHINGDGLDNRRSNLRPATVAQNNHNARGWSDSSSRFKGVTWHQRDRKWQAAIKVNGTSRYLGYFISEEDAAAAYAAAALEIQGEYAYAAREFSPQPLST